MIDTHKLYLLQRYPETISDGPGLRYAIYLSGCRHCCPGCHNPKSWRAENGVLLTQLLLDRIIDEINKNPLLDGITLSGGDPFYNPLGLLALLQELTQKTVLPICLYTGYTLEEIEADPSLRAALSYIDLLVEGRFVAELYDPTLLWRGSSNQHVIRLSDRKILFE